MAATKVAAFSICLLVLFAMVAQSHAAVCSTSSLFTCLNYVQGSNPPAPSAACCAVVRAADKTCMCNQLKSSTFPAQMVHNGLLLPKKCGRKDLAGFKCGRFIFPY